MPKTSPAVADLAGVWRRSLLADDKGSRDTTSTVTWVQGPTRYADLRQRIDRPRPRAAESLEDLSFEQLLGLAEQEAFAGQLRHVDGAFHWEHAIDFGPASSPDAGTLSRHGSTLVEEGVHSPYVEHWHPVAEAGPPYAAVELIHPPSGCRALLVRAGSWFGYARGRREPLPPGGSLAELIAGAAHPGRARELLDCEISMGCIADDHWIIERSTLPHREGRSLAPELAGSSRLLTCDTGPGGAPYVRRWEISEAEGALHTLAPAPGSAA
ncbi:hypothetical protein ACFYO2_44090 [Streptomyces sp. NPDC006602]|uniref:hypothetical protein n=1 Tax=Streptomyces sp. NPDC006602 TaxID=3364751 RepID=UPI00367DADBD